MAYYAFLDENNIVTEVIVGRDEDEFVNGITDWESYYSYVRNQVCKRTSYNTLGGKHNNGGTPFRKNYAGVGFIYDEEKDAFIPPRPYESWLLNEDTCLWEPPIPMPEGLYTWDEDSKSWIPLEQD